MVKNLAKTIPATQVDKESGLNNRVF